jgi:MarR family transcriptional regulator, 2-MHQ and catechol-resistance regulon repressor
MPTHYKGSQAEVRALNAYINLVRASDSVVAKLSGPLEAEGMTLGQFGVLEALLHLGPMCQHELGKKLLRSGGNITLVVDNLEKHGWVRRERQEDDRRMIRIHLTPAGRRAIERVFPKHARAIQQEMSGLSAKEQEDLRQICKKLGRGGNKPQGRKVLEGEDTHDSSTSQ